jgi:hypothetical protein
MLSNFIIGFFVFAAFFRAAREYGKNGVAWGLIGLVSFFTVLFTATFFVATLLTLVGAGNASLLISGLIGFVAAVATAMWVCNKLMERAIDKQAAIDSQASASAQLFPDNSESRVAAHGPTPTAAMPPSPPSPAPPALSASIPPP